MNKFFLFWVIAGLLLTACQSSTPAAPNPTLEEATPPTSTTALTQPAPAQTPVPTPNAAAPFAGLADFEARREAASTGDVEPFWQAVLAAGQMPLIFEQTGAAKATAVFLYRSPVQQVRWTGDFTYWQEFPGLEGERLGESDIWIAEADFERDARLDYKILVNGAWLLDPLNPRTQMGGFGPNSTLYMPGYVYPEISLARPQGLRGTLAENQTLDSAVLKYPVNYRVYTPAGAEPFSGLPVIYVTDGHEFAGSEMGGMVNTLDNLIADGKIKPVMAVFIDPRDPDTGLNRRDRELGASSNFGRFLVEELVPTVDAAYPSAPDPESRLILGTSWGGAFATYIGQTYPEMFHKIGIFSPYYIPVTRLVDAYAQSERLPQQIFLMQGSYDLDLANTHRMRDILQEKGYPLLYIETHDGHSWGNWRGVLDDLLLFFFST